MALLLAPLYAECAAHVAPQTMDAIVQAESSGEPFVIGINGRQKLKRKPADQAQAIRWVRWLVDHDYNVDAGLMQVNVKNWKKYGLTPDNVFDPCTNLRVGAQILHENYAQASKQFGPGSKALRAAISAYNTGNWSSGINNGYVSRVEKHAGTALAGGADRYPRAAPRTSGPLAAAVPPAPPPNPYQAPSGIASFADAGSPADTWGSDNSAAVTSTQPSNKGTRP